MSFYFFNSRQLSSVIFQGETIPFLKFNSGNFLFTHPSQEIQLSQSSIWIHASYLSSNVPANSFVGLKIKSGLITLDHPPVRQAGMVQIKRTATCKVSLTLDNSTPLSAQVTETGKDADETKANV